MKCPECRRKNLKTCQCSHKVSPVEPSGHILVPSRRADRCICRCDHRRGLFAEEKNSEHLQWKKSGCAKMHQGQVHLFEARTMALPFPQSFRLLVQRDTNSMLICVPSPIAPWIFEVTQIRSPLKHEACWECWNMHAHTRTHYIHL